MASHAGVLVRDENLNIPYNCLGVSARSKRGASMGKKEEGGGGLGGRKALRDLSNSVHPTPIQSSKKHTSNVVPFNDKPSSAFEAHGPSKKKGVSRVMKPSQIGGRKALSDISNSDEPRLDELPKKNPNAFSGEGFLHNHEYCVQSQKRDMKVNQFLTTLGLDSDSTADNHAKMKLFTPHRSLQVEEIAELLLEDPSPVRHQSMEIDSPLPSRTPKFLNPWMLDDQEHVSFKLTKTPKLLKP